MANIDDDFDRDDEADENKKKIDKKKILIFLLPVLIVIGLIVSFYSVFTKKRNSEVNLSYSVVERNSPTEEGKTNVLILYDLPEVSVQIKDALGATETLRMKINIELTQMEDIKDIEALMPKIIDAVIAHTIELTPDEISGSKGLYWLKEELLYRINLIVSPIVVSSINFKNFGTEKTN